MKTYTIEELKDKATKSRISGNSVDVILKRFIESLEIKPVIERIDTFENACEETGMSDELPFDPHTKDLIERSVNAYYKLCIIAKALNEEWEFDIKNKKQEVWWVYIYWSALISSASAGSGVSSGPFTAYTYYGASYAATAVGARLFVRSKPIAEYFKNQFMYLWIEFRFPEAQPTFQK